MALGKWRLFDSFKSLPPYLCCFVKVLGTAQKSPQVGLLASHQKSDLEMSLDGASINAAGQLGRQNRTDGLI